MQFKLAFIASFIFAVTVATMTARRAARRHGAGVNQRANEVRALLFVRGALGIVFYSMLIAWFFWPNRLSRAYELLVFPLSANWLLTLSGLLLVVSIAVIRIPIEEHELHERFGAEWEEYRKRQR